jgi:hypothetical protein
MQKLFFFLLAFLLWTGFARAQWSLNPGAPTRICSKNSQQLKPKSFPDGQGGLFVFWEDNRRGQQGFSDLYVQHFAANGTRLLPDSGKWIVTQLPGAPKTSAYGVSRDPAGNFWISWAAFPASGQCDSIVINKFNPTTFAPIWPKPKLISKKHPTNFNILGAIETRILPTADSALVTVYVTWMGGSNVILWNRISKTGERRLPNEGSYFMTGGGPYEMIENPFGGFYIVQRNGNGLGTGVTARRINKDGVVVWGPKSITDGTPGLGYDLNIQEDGTGGFVMVYVRTGNDIMATRWDSSGNAVWTPAHKVVCDYSSSQDEPEFVYNNGHWYVVWIDNRPPASNADVYMQKLNAQGNRLWNPNGRIVFRQNTYIPIPKILKDSDGDLIVACLANLQGFLGQKVRPDSTLVWPGFGRIIAAPGAENPFYEQYTLTAGPGGVAFPIWVGSASRSLFISSLDSNGLVTSVREPVLNAKPALRVFPNPVEDKAFLPGDPETLSDLTCFDGFGRTHVLIVQKTEEGVWFDTRNLKPGMYFIRNGAEVVRFLKE